jgi:5-formaminoimidazole-4-carboxamide-1-beta-D-ribofuranosyl 5'-monophosphate synthetase
MNTEQDAENFWNEVNRLLEQNESPDPIYEYRLYHDSDGNITSGYSLIINRPEPADLPKGSYIVVNREEYENRSDKIIKDGVLEKKRLLLT